MKFMHTVYISLSQSWLSCELDEKCWDFDFWICRDSVVGPDLRSLHPLQECNSMDILGMSLNLSLFVVLRHVQTCISFSTELVPRSFP